MADTSDVTMEDNSGLITASDPRSHKQRMLAGDWFWGPDPELLADQARASALAEEYTAAARLGWNEGAAVIARLFGRAEFYIKPPFTVDYGYNVNIGIGSFINSGCVLLDAAPIRIGENVLIGPGVQILTAYHGITVAARRKALTHAKPITIGDDAWIGASSILLPGVTIAAGAVVGAGSVVTKNVAPLTVVAGNPARVLRELEAPPAAEQSAGWLRKRSLGPSLP